jgi:hypothetical protein
MAQTPQGAYTNWAEEFFSRMRRAEIGHHHHIAGQYLLRYAQEATWREDNRRASNSDQVSRLAGLAAKHKSSVDSAGIGSGTLRSNATLTALSDQHHSKHRVLQL